MTLLLASSSILQESFSSAVLVKLPEVWKPHKDSHCTFRLLLYILHVVSPQDAVGKGSKINFKCPVDPTCLTPDLLLSKLPVFVDVHPFRKKKKCGPAISHFLLNAVITEVV